jgi:hypothetical protein
MYNTARINLPHLKGESKENQKIKIFNVNLCIVV